ncbi:hypothetical protein ACLESD_41150 [Pyxidicoccus sp. 3LFB2]
MSSLRLQSRPPVAEASEDASLAPWAPSQSLPELREAMSSPGIVQAEVDALFAAIARPLADDESPRARADFLQSLVDLPEEARERTGSDGRSVRAAAVEALLELGYPYALEVHPDVLEAVRLEARRRTGGSGESGLASLGPEGFVTLLALAVQLAVLWMFTSQSRTSDTFMTVSLGLVVLPPLSALCGWLLESRTLRSLGARGMALQGVFWLLSALIKAASQPSVGLMYLLFIPWYVPLVAAYLLRARPESEDAAPPESPEERT